MSNKKDNERRILQKVYGGIPDLIILNEMTEKPDFWLKYMGQNSYFDIEVTERFNSETSARLKKIPNYLSELIDGKPFRHKDDREVLEVGPIKIYDKEMNFKYETTAVKSEPPTRGIVLKSVGDKIIHKGLKARTYSQELDHINLIIYDHENSFNDINSEDFISVFFNPKMKRIALNSSFQEILYITSLKGIPEAVMPLKLMVFFNDYFVYNRLFFEFFPDFDKNVSIDAYMEYLNMFFKLRDIHNVKFHANDEIMSLFYANYEIQTISSSPNTNIIDYKDKPVPSFARPLNECFATNMSCTQFKDFILKNIDRYYIQFDLRTTKVGL